MRLLVDMNLSPDWVPLFVSHGWEAKHWSQVGKGTAPDAEIMSWAREHGHVIVTQDLDFSQILFATYAAGPSVLLLRMENEFDPSVRSQICASLVLAESALNKGALLTISGKRVRLRHLPIRPEN